MLDLNMLINIDIKNNKYDGKVRDIVKINAEDLNTEFSNHPSTFAWFAALAEIAGAEVETLNLDLSILRANLDIEKRKDLATANQVIDKKGEVKEGKVTEAMVESVIITDKRYKTSMEELIDIRKQFNILKAMVKALEHRKDMLIQLGSAKRQEKYLDDFGIDIKKVKSNN